MKQVPKAIVYLTATGLVVIIAGMAIAKIAGKAKAATPGLG